MVLKLITHRGASWIKRSIALICACVVFSSLHTTSAHAVSSGCVAVRGGALNVTANDLIPDFVGNFEAGETIIWTFTGSAIQQDVAVVPPGGNLAVIGGQATFTFATTGAYTIQESVSGTVTATCQETTAEKQTAVQAAVKTLTDMQLLHSRNFQNQLLQELSNAFLAGSSSAALSREAQGVINNLENRRSFLQSKINKERELLNGQEAAFAGFRKPHEQIIAEYNAQINKRDWSKKQIASIERQDIWQRYQNALKQKKLLEGEEEYHSGQHEFWYRERQRLNTIITSSQPHDPDRTDYINPTDFAKLKEDRRTAGENADFHYKEYRKKITEGHSVMYAYNSSSPLYGYLQKLIKKMETARQDLADANAALPGLEQPRADALKTLTSLNADLQKIRNKVNGNIAKFQAEINGINSEISRIQSGISTVDSRIRATTTPFQLANFQQGAAGTSPFILNGAGANNLNFFADLNSLQRARAQARANLFGQNNDAINNASNYNIWVKGNYNYFESDQEGAEQEGKSYAFATGTYYSFTPRFMAGIMYRYRHADTESTAQGSDLETKGHGVGVHTTYRFTQQFSFSGQILYERSENDLIRNGTSGNYDADNITTSGSFQGSYFYKGISITPSVGLTYAYVKTESFTDSAGTPNAGQTTKQLQMNFGPSFSYKEQINEDGIKYIEPNFSIAGVWSLKDEGDTTLASGTVIKQDNLSLQLSGGFSMLFDNKSTFSLNMNYSGLGASEVESYGIGGKLTIPLYAN